MASFLQSREWQEIQERMGRPTTRIEGALVIRHDLPLGAHYLYAPRPERVLQRFFEVAGTFAKESGAIFLKVDPLTPLPNTPTGMRAHAIQPQETTLVDCQRGEGEILAAMHPKTRYNIRLAEKRGVLVRRGDPDADFDPFYTLLTETAERDGFSLHPREHYRILLAVRGDAFSDQLWLAEHGGEVVAVILVNWYAPARTVTYLHGGSLRSHRDLMAPHLLHWRVIQEAVLRGWHTYDLGGIDDERFPGVTRFKKSFGGYTLEYPPTRDYMFRPLAYRLYRLQRALRHSS